MGPKAVWCSSQCSRRGELRAAAVTTLQLNVTRKCNQACRHCHVDASPLRSELMPDPVVDACLEGLARALDAHDTFGPRQRIKTQIQFEVHLGVNDRGFGRLLFDRGGDGAASGGAHQLAVCGTENEPIRLARRPQDFARAFDLILQLETFDFARRRAWQRFGAYDVIPHTLVFGQLATEVVQLESDRFARVGDVMRLEVIEIRDHHGERLLSAFEPARRVAHAEHTDFTQERGAPVMRLDVIGENLLAGRKFDHIFLPTDYVKAPRAIEATPGSGRASCFQASNTRLQQVTPPSALASSSAGTSERRTPRAWSRAAVRGNAAG